MPTKPKPRTSKNAHVNANLPATREACQKEIDRLTAHMATIKNNNHPAQIDNGMLFRDKRDGDLCIVTRAAVLGPNLVFINGEVAGNRFSSESLFGREANRFEYLGHARDLIGLIGNEAKPAEMPKITVTDGDVEYVLGAYRDFPGSTTASMRHALQSFVGRKLGAG